MRRKVVLGDESSKHQHGRGKPPHQQLLHSPRHGSVVSVGATNTVDTGVKPLSAGASSANGIPKELSHHDLEKKVMAAFSRSTSSRSISLFRARYWLSLRCPDSVSLLSFGVSASVVRMWRERKHRSEAQTLTLMNGNKLRKDNGIQSAHIVGILSRRMIREVPALQFFHVEANEQTGTFASTSAPGGGGGGQPTIALSSVPPVHHNTPRGVCYTLDTNGCRCIKMESGALRTSLMASRDRRSRKSEEITIEKAMAKTLRRKCVRAHQRVGLLGGSLNALRLTASVLAVVGLGRCRMVKRVKTKRQDIRKLADDFHKFRTSESMELQSQLGGRRSEKKTSPTLEAADGCACVGVGVALLATTALRQAEGEKMFATRLTLLMADDTSLPTYQAQKELRLARVRSRKADVLEKCQVLLTHAPVGCRHQLVSSYPGFKELMFAGGVYRSLSWVYEPC